jgi:hypothetical protein
MGRHKTLTALICFCNRLQLVLHLFQAIKNSLLRVQGVFFLLKCGLCRILSFLPRLFACRLLVFCHSQLNRGKRFVKSLDLIGMFSCQFLYKIVDKVHKPPAPLLNLLLRIILLLGVFFLLCLLDCKLAIGFNFDVGAVFTGIGLAFNGGIAILCRIRRHLFRNDFLTGCALSHFNFAKM